MNRHQPTSTPSERTDLRDRVWRISLRLGVVTATLAGVVLGVLYGFASERRSDLGIEAVLRNVREVDPGRFYRSAKLPPETLREVAETFGIRTVIDLRGKRSDDRDAQIEIAREYGIAHHAVHLSSSTLPRQDQVLRLLTLYRDVEKPILVHCHSGADRAGEASAIYAMEYMGQTNEQALESLSLRFRHWTWWRPAKRAFILAYRGEEWVRNEYDACGPEWGDLPRHGDCEKLREWGLSAPFSAS